MAHGEEARDGESEDRVDRVQRGRRRHPAAALLREDRGGHIQHQVPGKPADQPAVGRHHQQGTHWHSGPARVRWRHGDHARHVPAAANQRGGPERIYCRRVCQCQLRCRWGRTNDELGGLPKRCEEPLARFWRRGLWHKLRREPGLPSGRRSQHRHTEGAEPGGRLQEDTLRAHHGPVHHQRGEAVRDVPKSHAAGKAGENEPRGGSRPHDAACLRLH